MINEIGEIIKECIANENLPYIETLAGVVQSETATKLGKKKGEFVNKVFPIYCPLLEDCEPNNIEPLVPDKNRKSLFYFERNGDVIFNGRDKGYSMFTADLLLTGWLNPRKLGFEDCSISAPIIAELIKVLNKGYFNGPNGTYSKILIRPISVKTKEPSIFQKYKYNTQFYHLLEYPYDYFQIRIQVEFAIHDNCFTPLTPTDPIVC